MIQRVRGLAGASTRCIALHFLYITIHKRKAKPCSAAAGARCTGAGDPSGRRQTARCAENL